MRGKKGESRGSHRPGDTGPAAGVEAREQGAALAIERAEWKRVVRDLSLARSALSLYSSRRKVAEDMGTFMPFDGSTHEETHLYTVTVALWSNSVLAFSRCFSSDKRRRRLRAEQVFSLAELATYYKVRSIRDKTLAHSVNAADAAAFGLVHGRGKVGLANRVLVPPLGSDVAERLGKLIEIALCHAQTRLRAE